MSRLLILGATGRLGRHVLSQAVAGGHEVTVLVRTPSKLPAELRDRVSMHTGDLSALVPLELVRGQDALINCAGHVADGETFVGLIDRLAIGVSMLARAEQPICWFLAGAALLDIDASGRRGVDLPTLKSSFWPHRANFERLIRSNLDWRLLCPGPLVGAAAIGLHRLRISLDTLPVKVPAVAGVLPGSSLLPVFTSVIPQLTVPYAVAGALMLANLDRESAMTRHRVGLALPGDMRG